MAEESNTVIVWQVTLCETGTGSRFARLNSTDEWLNRYQLRRLISVLEAIQQALSGGKVDT